MRVLIPVLDSVNALPAVRYVIREFLNGERPQVRLLHVRSRLALALKPSLAQEDVAPARELLERHKIRHTVELESGDKAATIVAAARRSGSELIVLGTARYGSATRMSEDSAIQKLLQAAPVPLILVAGKQVSRVERYGIAAGLGVTLGLILFG